MARLKGRCVICSEIGVLTRDHVPPKGVVAAVPIEVRRLTDVIGDPNHVPERPRPAFQAPSFPTLCETCNTDRLGASFDPSLISFANGLVSWVEAATQSGLVLPSEATVTARPRAIARAVVGHLLAAEERKKPTAALSPAALPAAMREYFLRTTTNPAFRIYVWPYAGAELVIARGFGTGRVVGRPHGMIVGDVLKFFPVAFWVVGHAPDDVVISLTELPLSEDAEIALRIPLRNVPLAQWPERPGDQEIVILTSERTHVGRDTHHRR